MLTLIIGIDSKHCLKEKELLVLGITIHLLDTNDSRRHMHFMAVINTTLQASTLIMLF